MSESDQFELEGRFTVSAEVAQAAIAQVASCECCSPEAAEFPFECISIGSCCSAE